MAHRVDELPYAPSALEPYFDEAWLTRHREWHEGYVTQLNSLVAGTEWEDVPAPDLLRRIRELPDELREPVRESAGGHLNHSLLWATLGPDGGGEPSYEFLDDIEAAFRSFPALQTQVASLAEAQREQGWIWLTWNGDALDLVATDLEHNPIDRRHAPLLGVDLWEHAYEPAYPDRSSYLEALWHVVDWAVVEERFLEAEEASREARG